MAAEQAYMVYLSGNLCPDSNQRNDIFGVTKQNIV